MADLKVTPHIKDLEVILTELASRHKGTAEQLLEKLSNLASVPCQSDGPSILPYPLPTIQSEREMNLLTFTPSKAQFQAARNRAKSYVSHDILSQSATKLLDNDPNCQ